MNTKTFIVIAQLAEAGAGVDSADWAVISDSGKNLSIFTCENREEHLRIYMLTPSIAPNAMKLAFCASVNPFTPEMFTPS